MLSKRSNLETPNVGFRNRTYQANSNSTLAERRTPLTTPSPSLRASSEDGEEKAFLLTSSSKPAVPKSDSNSEKQRTCDAQNMYEKIDSSLHELNNGLATDEKTLAAAEVEELSPTDSLKEDPPDFSHHVYATITDESLGEGQTNAPPELSPLLEEPTVRVATASTILSETDLVDLDDSSLERGSVVEKNK